MALWHKQVVALMVGQFELLEYIKTQRAVTVASLCRHFNAKQPQISRMINQLNKYGFIEIIIEDGKYIIKGDEEWS